MARKTKQRTVSVKIDLFKKDYRLLAVQASQNVRTVEQELTYLVERQLAGFRKEPIVAPQVPQFAPFDAPAPTPTEAPLPVAGETVWSEAQENQIQAEGFSAGMTEGQIMALRLLHKTPEAVLAAIAAERGAPA